MDNLQSQAIKLRRQGLTYSLIQKRLKVKISKGTLSYWFKDVKLSTNAQIKNRRLSTMATKKSRKFAIAANKAIRQKHLDSIANDYRYLENKIKDKDTALIALSMIYLGEGSKQGNGSVMLGNSDPNVIKLFLYLLRLCYHIDERKFRCTVQCRADQNIDSLEKFWLKTTKIPFTQFYKTRVDPRTIGKPSKKPDYKGVCRINYLSADIFNRLIEISKILTGPIA